MTYLSRMRMMRGGTRGLTRALDCAVPPVAPDTGRRTQGACGAGTGSRRRVAPLSRSLGTPPRKSGRAVGASYTRGPTEYIQALQSLSPDFRLVTSLLTSVSVTSKMSSATV